jgi:hypothetical protein
LIRPVEAEKDVQAVVVRVSSACQGWELGMAEAFVNGPAARKAKRLTLL